MAIYAATAARTIIGAHLANPSSYPFQLLLNSLVDRGDHGTAISRYRCKVGSTYITTYDLLLAAIQASAVSAEPGFRNKDDLLASITILDVIVELNPICAADNFLSRIYGQGTNLRLCFDLMYPADGDVTTLPLKIKRLSLV